MKNYAVLFDLLPQNDGRFLPRLIQKDGTWDTLKATDILQVTDGAQSVYYQLVRTADETYSLEEAQEIAEKNGGSVVEVKEFQNDELRVLVTSCFARTGGQARSKAKAKAARENGKKGGRPKKRP